MNEPISEETISFSFATSNEAPFDTDAAEHVHDAELVEILADHGIHVDGSCTACRGLDVALLAWREADCARMAAELEQVRGATVPQFVWMHGNDEHSSQIAYVALKDAQEDAIWEYDPNLAEEPERWTWQPVIGTGALQLCCDGKPVPYEVYRVPVGLPSAPHDTKAESAYWRGLADQYFAERLGMQAAAETAAARPADPAPPRTPGESRS